MKKTTIFQHLFLTILVATSSITTLVAMNQIKPCFYCVDAPAPQYKKMWKRWWQALELKFNDNHPAIKDFVNAMCKYHLIDGKSFCKDMQDYVSRDGGLVLKWSNRLPGYQPVEELIQKDEEGYGYFVDPEIENTMKVDNSSWSFKDYFNTLGIDPYAIEQASPTAVAAIEDCIFSMDEDLESFGGHTGSCSSIRLTDYEKQHLVHVVLAIATPGMRAELYDLKKRAGGDEAAFKARWEVELHNAKDPRPEGCADRELHKRVKKEKKTVSFA